MWGSRGWGGGGVIALNCRRKVKSPLFRGGGGGAGGDGGGGYVVVIGPLAKVSLRHAVFSVIQLLVKSLWHRIKVAMA